MNYAVLYALVAAAMTVTILAGVPLIAWAGHSLGRRRLTGEAPVRGLAAIEGAAFALLGLLIAFTFGNAYSRLSARRALIVDEANAIGTAYLRLDFLPPAARTSLQSKFRDYVDARLDYWHHANERQAAYEDLARVSRLQKEIWTEVLRASEGDSDSRWLLVPALNEMFDLTTTRLSMLLAHPPPLIFIMLVLLTLTCSGMVGFAQAKAATLNWHYIGTFAGVIALTLYVILDIEYPRFGLITLDAANEFIENLRVSMGP